MAQNRIHIYQVEPPAGLKTHILERVALVERRSVRNHLILFTTGTLASFVAVIFTAVSLAQSFVQTGFYQYLSLMVSGDGSVLVFWKDAVYSLAESMPVIGTVGFLTALGFLVWLSANTFTNVRRLVLTQ